MNTSGMSVSQFLGHSNKGKSKKYLKKWSSEPPYAITVWLLPSAPIMSLWRHGFLRLETVKDKQTQAERKEVWGARIGCLESEEVLQKMHWRDKTTHTRDVPPVICPMCLMIEDVYQRIARGELSWVSPVFYFDGLRRVGKSYVQGQFVHAGGLTNMFANKKMSDAQRAAMAAVPVQQGGPIYQRDSWAQNALAKLEYGFAVVDHDAVSEGPQIAIVPNLLGGKVQTAIQHRKKELIASGVPEELAIQQSDPSITPYPFRWEHDPADGIEFSKMYDAIPLSTVRMTPAIKKILRSTEPPEMAGLAEKPNLRALRATLERHAMIKLPWDQYFEAAFKWEEGRKHAETAAGASSVDRAMAAAEGRAAPATHAAAPLPPISHPIGGPSPNATPAPYVPAPAPAQVPPSNPANIVTGDDGVEIVACDRCQAAIKITDPKCPHCGMVYEVEPVTPPPPPLRTRAQAAAGAPAPAPAYAPPPAAMAPAGGGYAPPPAPVAGDAEGGDGYPGDPNDDIPFAYNSVLDCVDVCGNASELWAIERRRPAWLVGPKGR